jgi:hypothetical protein
MRGDESFAYDLVVQHRPVNSRQALLFGSIEGKRFPLARFVHPYFTTLQVYKRDHKRGGVLQGSSWIVEAILRNSHTLVTLDRFWLP